MRNSNYPSQTEADRLKALNRYQILGTSAESTFDQLAEVTTRIFDLPICLISFVDKDEVFFKANIGFDHDVSSYKRDSLCNEVIKSKDITVIEDVFDIPELANNPYKVRFYAGAPLITNDGYRIGALCVMGYEPMKFDEKKQEILAGLAKLVMNQTALREQAGHLISENENIAAQNAGLIDYQQQIAKANRDLESLQDNFEILFQQAPVAIGIISEENHVFEQANQTLLNILGRDSALIGEPLSLVIPDLEDQDFLRLIDNVKETGKLVHGHEVRLLVWNENQLRSLYINITLQFTKNLETGGNSIMFILADITEQVIAKQLNEEANVVLMSAIDAGEMGYTVVEFATGKMTSNDQFKRNYGYHIDEQFNYPDLFEAMLPKYRQQIKKSVEHAIENNGVYRAEYEVKWKDGSVHWISAFGKPRYDMHGRASHIIGINKIIENR
jgi:PAS domain S-box-containing protein